MTEEVLERWSLMVQQVEVDCWGEIVVGAFKMCVNSPPPVGSSSPLGKGCICSLVPASWLSPAGGHLSRSGVCVSTSTACHVSSPNSLS